MARPAGDDLTASPSLGRQLGARIRERRTSLGQTLAQTARAAEVSVSHLSSIETGTNLPSLTILARVVAALELTLNEVLRDVGGGNVIRVEQIDDATTATRVLSHDELQLRITALVADPGEAGGCPIPPDGAEIFIFVHTGSLEVTVAGSVVVLQAGDSLDAEEPERISWRVVGPDRSISIWARGPLKVA